MKTLEQATEQKAGEGGGKHPSLGLASVLVAAGIMLSRITGLVRETFFAHFFGDTPAADAYKAAFRIPNFLQKLFGEGVLSASFIPVYARLLAEGDEKEARRVAGAIFTLLVLLISLIVLAGVLLSPILIEVIAPGFKGETRELTIRLVRIFFPAIGLLVMSAWCLGVLNSHRKFFISYAAPAAMNVVISAVLIFFGRRPHSLDALAVTVAWGAVAGSVVHLVIQLPAVLSLLGGLPVVFAYTGRNVRTVVHNFGPVFVSRGVVQLSAYVDQLLASLLPAGAVASLAYAQQLSLLPVSLFGMSVSAAELPAMSSIVGKEGDVAEWLRVRLNYGLRQMAFFVVPSAVAFLTLGDVVNAAVYQTGKFGREQAVYVWGILAGSAVGLLASTLGRLYSSAYYALRDTRTPLAFAVARVVLTSGLGIAFAFPLPRVLGIAPKWGAAGLTMSAGIAAWVEYSLLRLFLNRRIGKTGLPASYAVRLWLASAAAAALGWAIKVGIGHHGPRPTAVAVLVPYVLAYLGITYMVGLTEAGALLKRITRMANRR